MMRRRFFILRRDSLARRTSGYGMRDVHCARHTPRGLVACHHQPTTYRPQGCQDGRQLATAGIMAVIAACHNDTRVCSLSYFRHIDR